MYFISTVKPTVTDCLDKDDLTINKSFVHNVIGKNVGYADVTYRTVATCLGSTMSYYHGVNCGSNACNCIQADISG